MSMKVKFPVSESMPSSHAVPIVALIITKSDMAGAQKHVLSLLRGLESKFEFVLICGERGYLTEEAESSGIRVFVEPFLKRSIGFSQDFRAYLRVLKILRSLKPNIVHAHSSKAGVVGRVASKSLGLRVVFTAHGWGFLTSKGALYSVAVYTVEWLMSMLSDKIICVSKFDAVKAKKFPLPQSKITTIYNGVEPSLKHVQNRSQTTRIKVVCVARLSPQKNIACLLKAIAASEAKPELILVGDGVQRRELEATAFRLGLESRVDFLGERKNVEDFLCEADVFVLSSNWEGLPISVLEAMRAELPIVATRVGGLSEVVRDGQNGYLVERDDFEGMAKAIDKLAFDPVSRKRLGHESARIFNKEFSVERMLEETQNIYQELLIVG